MKENKKITHLPEMFITNQMIDNYFDTKMIGTKRIIIFSKGMYKPLFLCDNSAKNNIYIYIFQQFTFWFKW